MTIALGVLLLPLVVACREDGSPPSSAGLPAYLKPPASFEQMFTGPVDLPIKTGAHGLVARSGDESVSVPDRLTQPIRITDARGTTSVRLAGADVAGGTAAAGVAVYRRALTATDLAVRILNPAAVGVSYVINGASAPQRFETTIDGPAGTKLELAQGGVVLVKDGKPVGAAAPPWAYDAHGRSVPTHYEISGNRVVQVIEHHRTGIAYPVVADPNLVVGGVGGVVGRLLLGGVFQWVVGLAIEWAVRKAAANGCLSLSTFASCALHPFQYAWPNPAYPIGKPASVTTVPSVLDDRLPAAQKTLTGAGFSKIKLVDDTGQSRVVIEPDNWVVVHQDPRAGTKVVPGTQITLRVRKPSDGRGGLETTIGTIPDVKCMDLQAAQDKLRGAGFFNLTSQDGLGQHRMQIIDRNWVVIAQSRPPGSQVSLLTGIVLTVVKYGEPTGSSGCKS